MPLAIATPLCFLFTLTLYFLNRDRNSRVSLALWVPVIWVSICASRMVSQWLGGVGEATGKEFEQGNSFDAAIFASLLVVGLAILLGRERRARVAAILRTNKPLILFLLYCLLSVTWSDFPVVALKRWTKALGDLTMVLIVLTDSNPTASLRQFLARPGFALVPLSILLIRYYPSLGREYSSWTGEAFNIGVATGKNGLGYVCLIFGLGCFWSLLDALRAKERPRLKGPILAQAATLALTFWLFRLAHSATSFACFMIGSGLMTIARVRSFARKPLLVTLVVGALLFVVLYGLLINPSVGLVEAVGRDATLTGRLDIWNDVLPLTVSPLFGAGYESFWLGPRLEKIWSKSWGERPNQAHNGYLEVYLDLGWVGLALLGLVMIWGFWGTVRTLRSSSTMGRLKLAFFVVAAVYNLTEHGFRELHPVWIIFLFAVTVIPEPVLQEVA
jgi:exopolysaccharide production protein ExoQ